MPTYSYHCDGCGHDFDLFQRITEDACKVCPSCSQPSLRRLIGSGAGFIFKGSGFYTTDYRSKEYKEKSKSDEAPSTSSTPPPSPSSGETKKADPAA